MKFEIDPDVRRARTLPGEAYHSPEVFALARERVFARSWQCVLGAEALGEAGGSVAPVVMLPGCVDEPLVLTREHDGRVHCLSNVCTHRASLVVSEPGCVGTLRCRYHGRRFGLDGRLHHAPEFEGVMDFPAPSDDLPRAALERLGPLWFTALAPAVPFDEWIEPVRAHLAGLPLEHLVYDPSASRDYDVAANWALYCDNYLEGLHIPFVHGSLAAVLDYGAYRTELLPHGVLQVGVARAGEPALELPVGHPDARAGERVAALYFWLFPNVMLNFYPWGLSLNVVQPLGVDRTRVAFRSYVWDAARRGQGAGAGLDRVELEDEAVVEAVQKGVRARLYRTGRYSAARETGVHHFHRMFAGALTPPR